MTATVTMIKHPLEDYVWVFVGCGGTFYAASPYLAVLCKRCGCTAPLLIDPDQVTLDNQDRQWAGYGSPYSKVEAAEEVLGIGEDATLIVDRFNPVDSVLCRHTEGKPVIAIVNVDNNAARLEVARWLSDRVSDGIMIVSGCERAFGQCYPGIWKDGEPVYDWRAHHSDVVQDSSSSSDNPCNAQDVRANALTGVLVGMCIEDIARRMSDGDWVNVAEFYWDLRHPSESLSMWITLASCKERSPVL
ncbi:hypothetical protein LCGC14_1930160 [marine sediment metagenome]|uniref:THIF-type NAD/FAD binding fold domain-containing protein n=1 Tax=marine sediment metagenome TaxID=412755 RepID=A0A0F9I257_9ZZZZ